MKIIFFSISHTQNLILVLAFFCFSSYSIISQSTNQNSKTLIFVESGERKTNNSVEYNIKSFGIDHINSMITAYNTKLQAIDSNDVNNKIWVKRIKYELVLLRRRKLELTEK
ncbi:hypothetical protein N9X23_02685 [Flavobacteriales bacterium]|nr:hypothetical protein [Flavobacteriales bacterium]